MVKFVPKPNKSDKEVVSVRMTSTTLAEINSKASEYELSRNELINQMILYALENMDTKKPT